MNLKRRLLPITIALVLTGMLFVSWTPNWDSAQFIRSTKPFVHFSYHFDPAETSLLMQVAEDLENRLSVRHEWHKVSAREAQYDVVLTLQQRADTVQLEATLSRNDERIDHMIVRGQTSVKHELTGRLVTLLTDRIQAADKSQTAGHG